MREARRVYPGFESTRGPSHENLDQLDRDLVALEQEPGSRPL